MSVLDFEIVTDGGFLFCDDCSRPIKRDEPRMEVCLSAAGGPHKCTSAVCFECFMELPGRLAELRTDFANACEMADARRLHGERVVLIDRRLI